jgi:hypothetical protein
MGSEPTVEHIVRLKRFKLDFFFAQGLGAFWYINSA